MAVDDAEVEVAEADEMKTAVAFGDLSPALTQAEADIERMSS